MPEHASIACRQLADFAGRREKSQEKKRKKRKERKKKKRQGIKGEKTFLKINSGKTFDTFAFMLLSSNIIQNSDIVDRYVNILKRPISNTHP